MRLDWSDLPRGVKDAIQGAVQEWAGPLLAAETAAEGKNSEIALILTTRTGKVFVKGRHRDHPGVVSQQREASINPHVRHVSPRLLWQADVDGWNLLAFEFLAGRHADYTPGSPDLPAVVDVIDRLARTPCPAEVPLKRAEQRWGPYVPAPSLVEHLAGEHLLHTDLNPLNVLIRDHGAQLIDWAWPTRGPAWIDPAVLVIRLITAGHTPAQAEEWAARTAAWSTAPQRAIDTFAAANAALWAEIAADDPQPFKHQVATSTAAWWSYRTR
ncbi:MAG: hypothetical protein ACJ73S_06950 [Mycobacteriales bacterium]